MLIGYAAVYVLELIGEQWLGIPIYQWLALSPMKSGFFHIWQPVTHPVIHDPGAPIGFLINCLVFYFFAGTIESALGTRGFLKLYIIAALGGAAAGLTFSGLTSFSVPVRRHDAKPAGTDRCLRVAATRSHHHADVRTTHQSQIYQLRHHHRHRALTFLAQTNVHGAYHLGGIGLAWLYFRAPTQWLDTNWWRWKYFEHSQKKRRSRFTVVKGRNKDDDNPPTIH
jgi:hypothetical protein